LKLTHQDVYIKHLRSSITNVGVRVVVCLLW